MSWTPSIALCELERYLGRIAQPRSGELLREVAAAPAQTIEIARAHEDEYIRQSAVPRAEEE